MERTLSLLSSIPYLLLFTLPPFPFSPFTHSPSPIFQIPLSLIPPSPSDIQTPHNNPSETVMQERTPGCFPPPPKGADLIFPHHTPPPNPPPKNQASNFLHHLVTFSLVCSQPRSFPFLVSLKKKFPPSTRCSLEFGFLGLGGGFCWEGG